MEPSGVREEIVLVPHTHWDREWYEPHDVFRLRLVHVLDHLLEILEAEPAYRFTLDGQSAAMADYLEMRPENRARVERAIAAGQLAVGPFLILLDEFCCDGESIVRNLELGLEVARELGPEMRVGYLPDMFGHTAQMPQVLTGFGIADAALWRGVPAAVTEHAFAWEALDGSSVRCEYLFDGYGSALDLLALEGQLSRLATQYCHDTASWFGPDPVLGMLGTDHMAPPADLVRRLEAHEATGASPRLRLATMGEYLAEVGGARGRDLPRVVGELRSHARGNLLPGVFSIRTHLKQAMATAERSLTVAERLDAVAGQLDHRQFLRAGWYRLVESTAHDSVTGCGVDDTAAQVAGRLATSAHVARGVAERVMEEAARDVAPERLLVANTSGFARRAHVELTLAAAADEVPPGVQVLEELPRMLGDETMTTAELPKLLRRIHGRELFGQQINAWQVDPAAEGGGGSIRFDVGEVPVGVFDLAELTERLAALSDADPSGTGRWHVETVAMPRTRVLAAVDLDGVEMRVLDPGASAHLIGGGVTVSERQLDNGVLSVVVNDDGTATICSGELVLERALRLVDEGDRGDSYNYGPLAHDDVVSEPRAVQVEVLESGLRRGRLLVRRIYDVPVGVDDRDRDRRLPELVELTTDTVLELREGEPFLRVSVTLVNPARDHRLRLLVPAADASGAEAPGTGAPGAEPLSGSVSAGQYGVVARGRAGEGGWGEFPLPTFPATRFVSAGEATVLLRQLTEYEVVSEEHGESLALTLLRAVGMMSVNVHPLRDEPAGSEIPVPGAQYLGTQVTTHLAVLPSPHGWEDADAVRCSDLFRLDPVSVRGRGKPGADAEAPSPRVRFEREVSSGPLALESLRQVGSQVEARLVNYAAHDVPAPAWTAQWRACDLRGETVGERAVVRAGEIATWRTVAER